MIVFVKCIFIYCRTLDIEVYFFNSICSVKNSLANPFFCQA